MSELGGPFANSALTHWGRETHTCICVGKLTIIGSDNGLSPSRRQAIVWTKAGTLLIWPLGTNFSEILFEIHTFSFRKMYLEMSSGKRRPFCPGLNVLIKVSRYNNFWFFFLTIDKIQIKWLHQLFTAIIPFLHFVLRHNHVCHVFGCAWWIQWYQGWKPNP